MTSLPRNSRLGMGHGLKFASVPQVIRNGKQYPMMRMASGETDLCSKTSYSSKPWDFISHVSSALCCPNIIMMCSL